MNPFFVDCFHHHVIHVCYVIIQNWLVNYLFQVSQAGSHGLATTKYNLTKNPSTCWPLTLQQNGWMDGWESRSIFLIWESRAHLFFTGLQWAGPYYKKTILMTVFKSEEGFHENFVMLVKAVSNYDFSLIVDDDVSDELPPSLSFFFRKHLETVYEKAVLRKIN